MNVLSFFRVERPELHGYTRVLAIAALGLIVALWVLWPEWVAYPKHPTLDGEYVLQQIEIGKISIRHFHELPLWNAYDCHGIPMWDHPEGIAASPILLLLTPLPGIATYLLWDLFHVAAGFVAMWLLLRDEVKVSRLAAFAGAAMWACAPSLAAQTLMRHSTMLDLYLAPLALLLARRGAREPWYAVGLGFFLVFLLLEGATYPLPMIALLLVFDTLARVRSVADAKATLRCGGIAIAVALGVGAVRWIPLADELTRWRRVITDDDVMGPRLIASAFLDAVGTTPQLPTKPTWEWHEYIAYIGEPLAALALVGAVLMPKGKRHLLIVAALLATLMLGYFHPLAPASLVRKLPLFKAMRVTARYRHFVVLFLCILVAVGVDELPRRVAAWRPRLSEKLRVVCALFAIVGVGAAASFSSDLVASRFGGAEPANRPVSSRLYYGGPNLAHSFVDLPRHNRAWMSCRSYEWLNNSYAPVWEGDVEQVKVVSGEAAITRSSRTANSFRFHANVSSPARLVLNSGHAPGWRSNVGTVVLEGANRGGGGGAMLAVELPPGEHDVVVRYWPRTLTAAMGASLFSVATIVALWTKTRRRRKAREAA